jgi:GT2 family glycosyltransferase
LKKCVASIAAQSLADFECFIVDNNSSDGSLDQLPKLDKRFKIIKLDDNTGFAVANNIAAKRARSPWLALLNPDAFADPDWLEKLLAEAQTAPNIKMVGSLQYLYGTERKVLDGFGDCYHISGIAYRSAHQKRITPETSGLVFGPCAAAALYERDLFLKIGGFDESFFCYHEDVDLAFRIQLAGGDCVQSKNAIVEHVSSGISDKTPEFALYHGARNRIWTFAKNMPLPLLIGFFPLHIFVNMLDIIRAALKKGRLRPTVRGIVDGFKGIPRILKSRKHMYQYQTLGVLALLIRFTYSPQKLLTRGIHIRKLP